MRKQKVIAQPGESRNPQISFSSKNKKQIIKI